jgi:hypothetical protein
LIPQNIIIVFVVEVPDDMPCVDFLIVGEEVGQRTHGVEEDGLHLFFLVPLAPVPLPREVLDSQTLDEQVIEKQVLVIELVECT